MSSSPKSVSINVGDIENNEFSNNFKLAAGNALEFLKTKLGKESISGGDSLEEFLTYENEDNDHLTELFCLAVSMLKAGKENIDNLDLNRDENRTNSNSTYDKLLRHLVSNYENRLK